MNSIARLVVGLLLLLLSMSALSGCGKSQPAAPTLVQQVDIAMQEPNAEIRARTLLELAGQQRAMKDLPGAAITMEKAFEAAKQIKEPAARVEVLLTTARESAAVGGSKILESNAIDLARSAAETIPNRTAKVATKIMLAEALKQNGEAGAAKVTLESAESLVAGITEAEEKLPLMASLAAARYKNGNRVEAEALLKAAREEAKAMTNPRARVRTEAQSAATLYRTGWPDEGRKSLDASVDDAQAISDPLGRSYALGEIVEAMRDFRMQVPLQGLLTEAGNAAREVKDIDQQTVLMRHLQTLQAAPK